MPCASSSSAGANSANSHHPAPRPCPSTSVSGTDPCDLTLSTPTTNSRRPPMNTDLDALKLRAKALNLNGLLAHWQEAAAGGWLPSLLDWEEQERARRSPERRVAEAHIGRFKPLSDFDWAWPQSWDRSAIAALMTLDFFKQPSNMRLVPPHR